MKRIAIGLLSFLCCSLPLLADDAELLAKIEKANSSVKSIEAHFQHKSLRNGKRSAFSGTYYYMPGRVAMQYSADTEAMIIDGDRLYIKRDGKVTRGDAAKNPQVRSLSGTLMNCLQGRVLTVAEENQADWKLAQDGKSYIVTISARKKAARGYSRIVLKFRKVDLLLTALTLEEFGGAVNEYEMTGCQVGQVLPQQVFQIPAKS